MRFALPHMALLALILPALWALALLNARRRTKVMLPTARRLAGLVGFRARLAASLPGAMLAAGLLLLTAAAMRPMKGWERVEWRRSGIDIILLLDLSNSMRVEDVNPNRLEAVKLAARSFVQGMDQDRIGLMTMTEFSLYRVPLTTDYASLLHIIDGLGFDEQGRGGSALGEGILSSVNVLKDREGDKVIVMVSDGAPEVDTVNIFDAARVARHMGVRIYAIGVGTVEGGPVPQDDPFRGRRYSVDETGRPRIVRLEEENLERVAAIGGGLYFSAADLSELDAVFEEIARLERTDGWMETRFVWRERYAWFLVPALALLVLGPALEAFWKGRLI